MAQSSFRRISYGRDLIYARIQVTAPNDIDSTTNFDLQFQASSTNDANAPLSEKAIPVTVESSQSSGSLTSGISEVGEDDLILYGAIAGGVILLFLLLGVVSRSIKKKNAKQNLEQEAAIELDELEAPVPRDEFDDLFSDLDDIDLETDEFDDLLDEF